MCQRRREQQRWSYGQRRVTSWRASGAGGRNRPRWSGFGSGAAPGGGVAVSDHDGGHVTPIRKRDLRVVTSAELVWLDRLDRHPGADREQRGEMRGGFRPSGLRELDRVAAVEANVFGEA